LEYDKVDSKGMIRRAKLNLGDLAGSEKVIAEETNEYETHQSKKKV
jgi:hypothetical protein